MIHVRCIKISALSALIGAAVLLIGGFSILIGEPDGSDKAKGYKLKAKGT